MFLWDVIAPKKASLVKLLLNLGHEWVILNGSFLTTDLAPS